MQFTNFNKLLIKCRINKWIKQLTLAVTIDLLTRDIKSWHHKSTKLLASGTSHFIHEDVRICASDSLVRPKYRDSRENSDSPSLKYKIQSSILQIFQLLIFIFKIKQLLNSYLGYEQCLS